MTFRSHLWKCHFSIKSIWETTVTMYYSIPDKEALKKEFVGKSLKDVPTPAAVLDLSKMKANCQKMLDATQKLGFGWRAHIKTHKVIPHQPLSGNISFL